MKKIQTKKKEKRNRKIFDDLKSFETIEKKYS